MGVRLYEISWTVERERAQTTGQGPKVCVKWKRMWDFKDNQDVGSEAAIRSKECVTAHWSRGPAPKMSGAKNTTPKPWN